MSSGRSSAVVGTVAISASQLAYMLDGIDWRNGKSRLGKIPFDRFEIVGQAAELAQVTRHCQTLISGHALFGNPSPALGATQILMRAGRDQMGVQDRLNDVLQPRALAHDLVAPRACVVSSAIQTSGKKAAGKERRQHSGIDLVSFDRRMRSASALSYRNWHPEGQKVNCPFIKLLQIFDCFPVYSKLTSDR
jgi:hypothetical protein